MLTGVGVLGGTGSGVGDGTGSGSDEGSGVGEISGADDASGVGEEPGVGEGSGGTMTVVGTRAGGAVLRVVATTVASGVGCCVDKGDCPAGVSADEQASARPMSNPGNRIPHPVSFRMGLREHADRVDATGLLLALTCVVAWSGPSRRWGHC